MGTLLLAELIGARSCIFVKDEQGLYTDDPKKTPDAEFIPEVGARSLLESKQDDLIVERPCLEILENSRVLDSFQVVNGLEAGNLTRALAGEQVGTVFRREGP